VPKGLATVGGTRVVDRVAAALRPTTDGLLLVANEAAADEWLPAVPRIGDLRPGLGPLGGIHAALTHLGTAILVVAWDMPFVPTALLAELRRRGRSRHLAVVPESARGQLEPTCAYYAAGSRGEIERWFDGGRTSAADFLEACDRVHRVPVTDVERFGDPARLFFSINTPAALARAEALSLNS
jgi:molybdopterin-guanine dinucleotide biosynthesis protein A